MKSSINEIIVECKGVAKSFKSHKQTLNVLENIDLTIRRGEFLVIEGRSGAGKTTLSNILCGIEPATKGEVIFDEIPYNTLNNEQLSKLRGKNIGIIFQNFNLIPAWTAFENIEAAVINNNLTKAELANLIDSYLNELGIINYKHHKPGELSIGQQQRVAVIRAIINEPKLILGDEPTGDVDKETGKEIMNLLTKVIEKTKATMIVTTHGEFSLDYATRVLTLSKGKLNTI